MSRAKIPNTLAPDPDIDAYSAPALYNVDLISAMRGWCANTVSSKSFLTPASAHSAGSTVGNTSGRAMDDGRGPAVGLGRGYMYVGLYYHESVSFQT